MSELTEHLVTVFFAFFAIMNPVGGAAIFVSLTSGMDKKEAFGVAVKSVLTTFIIIALFAVTGKALFHFFGITLPALRLTGGILVFIIGYQMLHGKASALHNSENKTPGDIAISPLAVPLMAGPGTIATAMNFSASGQWMEIVVTVSVFAFLCLVTFGSYVFGDRLLSLFGGTGLDIMTRLMGLILCVIGAQMFIEGVFSSIQAFS